MLLVFACIGLFSLLREDFKVKRAKAGIKGLKATDRTNMTEREQFIDMIKVWSLDLQKKLLANYDKGEELVKKAYALCDSSKENNRVSDNTGFFTIASKLCLIGRAIPRRPINFDSLVRIDNPQQLLSFVFKIPSGYIKGDCDIFDGLIEFNGEAHYFRHNHGWDGGDTYVVYDSYGIPVAFFSISIEDD
jgi:hypothetical protein